MVSACEQRRACVSLCVMVLLAELTSFVIQFSRFLHETESHHLVGSCWLSHFSSHISHHHVNRGELTAGCFIRLREWEFHAAQRVRWSQERERALHKSRKVLASAAHCAVSTWNFREINFFFFREKLPLVVVVVTLDRINKSQSPICCRTTHTWHRISVAFDYF